MVSLKEIAQVCGVSVATVSKALNDQQDVSAEVRARIRAVADEMGYMANASARALKTRRSWNIGVLFVDPTHGGLAHEFFSGVLDGIRTEAERLGYDITFLHSGTGARPSTYLQHCHYRGLDGVVIASVNFEDPMVRELVESDIPVVTIDHVFNHRLALMSDNTPGMEALTRHVIERGHRKLTFIHGEMTSVTRSRLVGFYRACEEAGLNEADLRLMEGRFHSPDRCRALTEELLSGKELPDCLFFPDDYSALGGLAALQEAGIRIPQDLSVAAYDGIPLSQVLSPKLTTWQQDTRSMGRAAVEGLVKLIESPRTALVDRVIVSGQLLEGETVSDRRPGSEGNL